MKKQHLFIRITAALLALCLLPLAMSACGRPEVPEETSAPPATPSDVEHVSFKLPFSAEDSLNPYLAESLINRQLSALLFDGLFTLGEGFEPSPVIAESFSLSPSSLSVKLKDSLEFTDGSPLNAEDVVYSFNTAKLSAAYSGRLSGFASVTALDPLTVVFALTSPDPYAVSCLDFAVCKNGTAQGEEIPVGSGRYIVSDDKSSISANTSRLGGFSPYISTALLIDAPSSESMSYMLEIGSINFCFESMSSGSYSRITANTLEIPTNNFVFLGINNANALLASNAVRRAVSLLIDRNELVNRAFLGHANAAYAPFNPSWYAATDFSFDADTEAALELLRGAGFRWTSSYGIRYGDAGSLAFTLLVPKGNAFKEATADFIVSALAPADIKITVSALESEEFAAAAAEGAYDFILAETKQSANMSLSPFFDVGGTLSTFISTSGTSALSYASFLSGSLDIKGFSAAFGEDTPFIPLCYRTAICACTRTLNCNLACQAGDVYCNIEGWKTN